MLSKWYFIEALILIICPIPHYEFYVTIDYRIKDPTQDNPKNFNIVTIH